MNASAVSHPNINAQTFKNWLFCDFSKFFHSTCNQTKKKESDILKLITRLMNPIYKFDDFANETFNFLKINME